MTRRRPVCFWRRVRPCGHSTSGLRRGSDRTSPARLAIRVLGPESLELNPKAMRWSPDKAASKVPLQLCRAHRGVARTPVGWGWPCLMLATDYEGGVGFGAGALAGGDRDGFERWTGESGSVRVCSGRWATVVPAACGGALGDDNCSLGGVIRTELSTVSGGRTCSAVWLR